jgi:hypothetical protein
MSNIVNVICILLFIFIGIGFIGWGCAQMMYIVPYFNRWSDLFGLLFGTAFIGLAYLAYLDSSLQRHF